MELLTRARQLTTRCAWRSSPVTARRLKRWQVPEIQPELRACSRHAIVPNLASESQDLQAPGEKAEFTYTASRPSIRSGSVAKLRLAGQLPCLAELFRTDRLLRRIAGLAGDCGRSNCKKSVKERYLENAYLDPHARNFGHRRIVVWRARRGRIFGSGEDLQSDI